MDTAGQPLSKSDIENLLDEVSDALARRDVRGELFLVGGAAMALAYGRDRLTHDVDAIFEPTSVIREVAAEVGKRHGLADDWLNDASKAFLLGDDPGRSTYYEGAGLRVQIASPRYLFVMKALAARVDRDAGDLQHLYRASGFVSVDEALDYVQATTPPQFPITPKTEYLLRDVLSDVDPIPFAPKEPLPKTVQELSLSGSRTTRSCGAPLPRGGRCTEGLGHKGRHRRR